MPAGSHSILQPDFKAGGFKGLNKLPMEGEFKELYPEVQLSPEVGLVHTDLSPIQKTTGFLKIACHCRKIIHIMCLYGRFKFKS